MANVATSRRALGSSSKVLVVSWIIADGFQTPCYKPKRLSAWSGYRTGSGLTAGCRMRSEGDCGKAIKKGQTRGQKSSFGLESKRRMRAPSSVPRPASFVP